MTSFTKAGQKMHDQLDTHTHARTNTAIRITLYAFEYGI